MAERRMFAKTIIDSDAFIDMPVTARLLYYDLAMRADDDGFVNSPKKIMRIIGASQDDINILIMRKFILPFDNGVVVIKHWRIHNYIRKDTYNTTPYTEELALLELDENKAYRVKNDLTFSDCNTSVDGASTQVRLGKVRLDKNNIILSKIDNADEQKNPINFQNIVDIYNSVCISLPKVIKLTETRKKAIKSAIEIIGDNEDDFKIFFQKVEISDFLCGRTEKAWTGCGFDWILKKSNLIKIVEGNFDNRSQNVLNQKTANFYDVSRYEKLEKELEK